MTGVNFLTAFLTIIILTFVSHRYAKRWGERLGEWSADRYGEQMVDALLGWMERHPRSRITGWIINHFAKHYDADAEG